MVHLQKSGTGNAVLYTINADVNINDIVKLCEKETQFNKLSDNSDITAAGKFFVKTYIICYNIWKFVLRKED